MTFLRRNMAAVLLLSLGVLSIAIGVWRGEMALVLRKAALICMECIGLG